jgi:hypothetical protein
MKIYTDATGNVLLRLRNYPPAVRKLAEVILDLNPHGNWIRGFEMIGGMFDFPLRKAVEPFGATEPELGDIGESRKLKVTYDPEADAAYFYLPYGSRFRTLSSGERDRMTKYSHSINPTATCELDASGGLVSVSVPTADATGPLDTFLCLFDVETQMK